MKLEYIVVYDNSLYKCDIGHCWIKVKVTAEPHLPQYKMLGPVTELCYKLGR